MEGSDVPAAQPSGPVTKRRSRKTNIMIVLASIVVVIVIIAAAVLIYSPSKSSPSNSSLSQPFGLLDGDHFYYAATGNYKNTSIDGFYNVTLVGNASRFSIGGFSYLNSTVSELNNMMNNGGLNLMSPMVGYDVGIGTINTVFGTKNVTLVFQAHNGWAVVYYRGYDPYVIYGCVANGPDFHLSLLMNQTNNHYVIDNNTSPVELPAQQAAKSDTYRFITNAGDISQQVLYLTNGANFSYNITGNGTNLYTYSNANILSMANGGQFTYYSPMTWLNVTNSTGNLNLSPGYYVTTLFAGNGPGEFDYDLKVF